MTADFREVLHPRDRLGRWRESLDSYVGPGGYRRINGHLRGTLDSQLDPDGNLQERVTPKEAGTLDAHVAQIDAALAQVEPLPSSKVLWRGVPWVLREKSLAPGDTIEEPAYASTSAGREFAEGFADEAGDLLRITVPKGGIALDVGTVATGEEWRSREKEWLLPRGARFVVTKVEPRGEGRLIHVRLEAAKRVQEAAYEEALHPRDRLGRWIKSLGFPAYAVGGAVRDPLLGKEPSDVDFMLMASPEKIKKAIVDSGGRADDLMVRDRLVGVRAHMEGVTPPEGVELAPPRVELSTGPGRHDFVIEPHPAVMGDPEREALVRQHIARVGSPWAYHMTTDEENVGPILRDGLRASDSGFDAAVSSAGLGAPRPGHVYLSMPNRPGREEWFDAENQLRVDLRRLDPGLLVPDEDTLLDRHPELYDEPHESWGELAARHPELDVANEVEASLRAGTVAVRGSIPAGLIERNPHYTGLDGEGLPGYPPESRAVMAASLYGAPPERVRDFALAIERLDTITRADVEAGRVPGVQTGGLAAGVAGHAGLADGAITLTPSSFSPDGTVDSVHFAHEVGHYLTAAVIKDGRLPDELLALEGERGRAEGRYGAMTGSNARLFGPDGKLPEEFIADSYADLVHGRAEFSYTPGLDGPDDPEYREQARREHDASPTVQWLRYLAGVAGRAGLPDRGLWRFTPDGDGGYRLAARESSAPAPDPIRDDALRRDFTVNALYQDEATGEVIDPLGGLKDMERRQLRTTSPDSFRDDPLRMLRALRFMSQHGFALHPDTEKQMRESAGSVTALTQGGVSGTARKELDKLLMGEHVGPALRKMRDTGVLAAFLPELAPTIGFDQQSKYHDLKLDDHIIGVVENAARLGAPLEVRLAALFHDAGKPEAAFMGKDGRLHFYGDATHPEHAEAGAKIARAALTRLRYPRVVVDRATRLVKHHMVRTESRRPARVRQWRAEVGVDLIEDLLLHRRADMTAKGEGELSADATETLDRFAALARAEDGAPTVRSDLAITGNDLVALGVPKGPQIGATLDALLKRVISDPGLNRSDWLLKEAAKSNGLKKPEPVARVVLPPADFFDRQERGEATARLRRTYQNMGWDRRHALTEDLQTYMSGMGELPRVEPGDGLQGALQFMAERNGLVSAAEYDRALVQKLDYMLHPSRSQVAVRVWSGNLEKILRDDAVLNAHDATMWHPGDAKSDSYRENRKAWEQEVWNVEDSGDPTQFPIYGYLSTENEDLAMGGAGGFGDVKLTLRPHARERTTFVYSDSNYIGVGNANAMPTPVDRPGPESIPYNLDLRGIDKLVPEVGDVAREVPVDPESGWAKRLGRAQATLERDPENWGAQMEQSEALRALEREAQEKDGWSRWSHGDFFEAQIHGGLRFSEDVESVTFQQRPDPALIAALDRMNIAWRVQGAAVDEGLWDPSLHPRNRMGQWVRSVGALAPDLIPEVDLPSEPWRPAWARGDDKVMEHRALTRGMEDAVRGLLYVRQGRQVMTDADARVVVAEGATAAGLVRRGLAVAVRRDGWTEYRLTDEGMTIRRALRGGAGVASPL